MDPRRAAAQGRAPRRVHLMFPAARAMVLAAVLFGAVARTNGETPAPSDSWLSRNPAPWVRSASASVDGEQDYHRGTLKWRKASLAIATGESPSGPDPEVSSAHAATVGGASASAHTIENLRRLLPRGDQNGTTAGERSPFDPFDDPFGDRSRRPSPSVFAPQAATPQSLEPGLFRLEAAPAGAPPSTERPAQRARAVAAKQRVQLTALQTQQRFRSTERAGMFQLGPGEEAPPGGQPPAPSQTTPWNALDQPDAVIKLPSAKVSEPPAQPVIERHLEDPPQASTAPGFGHGLKSVPGDEGESLTIHLVDRVPPAELLPHRPPASSAALAAKGPSGSPEQADQVDAPQAATPIRIQLAVNADAFALQPPQEGLLAPSSPPDHVSPGTASAAKFTPLRLTERGPQDGLEDRLLEGPSAEVQSPDDEFFPQQPSEQIPEFPPPGEALPEAPLPDPETLDRMLGAPPTRPEQETPPPSPVPEPADVPEPEPLETPTRPPELRETPPPAVPRETDSPFAEPEIDVPERESGVTDSADEEDTECDRIYNRRNCCSESRQCDEAWDYVQGQKITDISLSISPPLVPFTNERPGELERARRQLEESPTRSWRNREGRVLVTGKLADYRYGRIVIRDDAGRTSRIPFRELSNDDLCFVTSYWNLPPECVFADTKFEIRDWTMTTMTWTASALCHKPLYFQDVQLERYGHSAGPVLQPLLSGAHFFGSAILLPYSMGLYPPNECRYDLGYYRPGNCAPWMVPAFPISKRAILSQTMVVLGWWGYVN